MNGRGMAETEIERKKGKYLFIFVSFTSLDLSLCTTNGRLADKQRPKYVSSSFSSTSFLCVAISSTHNVARCVVWIMNSVMCRIMTFEIKQFNLTKMGERSLLLSLSLSLNACYMTATRFKGVKRVQTKQKQRKE